MLTKHANDDERMARVDRMVEEHRPTPLNESARIDAVRRASHVHARILMLMPQRATAQAVHTLLRAEGHHVDRANTCAAGVQRLADLKPDLILTDLLLPDRRGADLCRHLRRCSAAAVMVVTSIDNEDTCAEALGAGADDYVVMPVQPKMFVARVAALLRRAMGPSDEVVAVGDVTIDLRTRDVTVGARRVRLRPHEFDLLLHLARHPSAVLSHRTLLAAVWGPSIQLRPHYVRMAVAHLRRQIEPTPAEPRYLLTERAIGYRLEPSGVGHRDFTRAS